MQSESNFSNQKPYVEDYLDTGDGHQLYFACFGNPKGKPIINLHGGPGYGSEPAMVRFFDPQHWHILLFDQRGSGRSRPSGSLQNNTTQHLINDINLLADHIGFKTFAIKGGSWGVTLALAYAQAYPHRVTSMILRGVFLGEKEEALIGRTDGIQRQFPDMWHYFTKILPEDKRDKPFETYCHYILNGTEEEKQEFAKEAIILESIADGIGRLRADALAECETLDFYSVARIEYHYWNNDFFLAPNQILEGCGKIKDIPASIVHGRYDMSCPPESAWRLANRLNNCELVFADPAGHSEDEPLIARQLYQFAAKHLESG